MAGAKDSASSRWSTTDQWIVGADAALGAAILGVILWRRAHPMGSPKIVSIYEGLGGPGLSTSVPPSTVTGSVASYRYTVQAGDTLSAIAPCAGTTVSALAAMNHLSNPNRLTVGQVLILPHPYACEAPPAEAGPRLIIDGASVGG